MNRHLTRSLVRSQRKLLLQPVTTMADPPAHARNENSESTAGGGDSQGTLRDGR